MPKPLKILTVIGTRPEAIKMAPLIRLLNASDVIEHKLCSTGQHKEMLEQVFSFFEIEPDFELEIMKPGQQLAEITAHILLKLNQVFAKFKPDWILVHGDTATCFAAALAAFYAGIKVAHVEAGLRTGNLQSPFPEEANRILTDRITDLYFVPTPKNYQNLIAEGIQPEKILVTGNTVIDALYWAKEKVIAFSENVPAEVQSTYQSHSKILLVTGHRRENFGHGFQEICEALKTIAITYPEMAIVYPVHLNPNVKEIVYEKLSGISNIYLTEPMDYPDFIYAMKNCWVILTDSGGIQEEAPSLGKPVLVMRDTTERPEALEAGGVKLVGTNASLIVSNIKELITDQKVFRAMSQLNFKYGNGNACTQIMDHLLNYGVYAI